MLTTSPASRRRLAAGSAAVALMATGSLGLTASGSQAAERLGDSVQTALAQAAPIAPPAPPAAVAPNAPPAPADAPKEVKKHRIVIVNKDGKTQRYEGAEADAYIAEHDLPVPPVPPAPRAFAGPRPMPNIVMRRFHAIKDKDGKVRRWEMPEVPEISSRDCAGEGPATEHSAKGGKQRIVICTNRIARIEQDAERVAFNGAAIERHALMSARAGLAMARSSIERDRNLSDESRREALEGIAQAEAQLKDELRQEVMVELKD